MNVQKMMKQVQKMQAEMAKAQEALGEKTVEATAGGGVVTVTANGHQQILSIKIDPAAVDPDDVEMLEDSGLGRRQRGFAPLAGDGRRSHGPGDRRAQHPGTARILSLWKLIKERLVHGLVCPPHRSLGRGADQAAGDRPQDGPAFGIVHRRSSERRCPCFSGSHRRCTGKDHLLLRLLQPDGCGSLSSVHPGWAGPLHHLCGGGSQRRDRFGAYSRV